MEGKVSEAVLHCLGNLVCRAAGVTEGNENRALRAVHSINCVFTRHAFRGRPDEYFRGYIVTKAVN